MRNDCSISAGSQFGALQMHNHITLLRSAAMAWYGSRGFHWVCKTSGLGLSFLLIVNFFWPACSFVFLALAVTAISLIDQMPKANFFYFLAVYVTAIHSFIELAVPTVSVLQVTIMSGCCRKNKVFTTLIEWCSAETYKPRIISGLLRRPRVWHRAVLIPSRKKSRNLKKGVYKF